MSKEPDEKSKADVSEDEITVRYGHSDDYQTVTATSVIGGHQPSGFFKMDFVLDSNPDVLSERYTVSDDGSVGDRVDVNLEEEYLRERKAGILMAGDDAYESACWIISNVIGGEATDLMVHEAIAEAFDVGDGEENEEKKG